jgi:Cu-processing system permease protein
MRTVAIIAAKELRDGVRNRWIVAAILLLAGLALAIAFLGSGPVGTINASRLSTTVAGLTTLSVYLVPLIALMLSYDAIIGEIERGTLLLLLSYPVRRWQVLAGKFFGHLAILILAIGIGYGLMGLAIWAMEGVRPDEVPALLNLIGSSVLLGAVFLALGYLLSTVSRERATAAGLAVALWLVLAVIYDLALLGLIVADGGRLIGEELFSALLMVNPTSAFRIHNLMQYESVSAAAGLIGPDGAANYAMASTLGSMTLWLFSAGLAAQGLFRRVDP